MMVQSIDTDGVDLPWASTSTAIFQRAQARYIGMAIQDPTNLALRDGDDMDLTGSHFDSLNVSDPSATSRSHDPLNNTASSHLPRSKSPGTSGRSLSGPPPSTPLPQLPNTAQISAFASQPIALIVGGPTSPSNETSPVTFHAHVHILTSMSPFFRAALDQRPMPPYPGPPQLPNQPSGFLESTTGTINLPEERPEDIAFLLQWLYWRHHQSIQPQSQAQSSPLSSSPQAQHTCLPSPRHIDSPTSDFGLTHSLIDPAVHAYRSWLSGKKLLKETFGASSSEVRAYRKKRPAPPSFGPLVRLYLLADRYGVAGSLKWCICERVRWVGREANCVLEREDVAALWEGMVMVEGSGVGLKRVVLEMFGNLRGGSVLGLFGGEEEMESEGNGESWHGGFMRDLVMVLFKGLGSLEKRERATVRRVIYA